MFKCHLLTINLYFSKRYNLIVDIIPFYLMFCSPWNIYIYIKKNVNFEVLVCESACSSHRIGLESIVIVENTHPHNGIFDPVLIIE